MVFGERAESLTPPVAEKSQECLVRNRDARQIRPEAGQPAIVRDIVHEPEHRLAERRSEQIFEQFTTAGPDLRVRVRQAAMNGAQVLVPKRESQQPEDPLHGVAFLVAKEHDDERVSGRQSCRLCRGAANEVDAPVEKLDGAIDRTLCCHAQSRLVEAYFLMLGRGASQCSQDLESNQAIGRLEQLLLQHERGLVRRKLADGVGNVPTSR